MRTPLRMRQSEVDALARGLHRRQILAALSASGVAVEPDEAAGTYQIRDAENRSARLAFQEDGGVRTEMTDGLTSTQWFDSEGRVVRLVDPGGLEVTNQPAPNGGRRISRGDHGDFVVEHDPFGLPTRFAFPDGTESRIDWDTPGGETITDRAGNRSRRLRRDDGTLTGYVDARGGVGRFDERTEGEATVLAWHTPGGRLQEFVIDSDRDTTTWRLNGADVAELTGQSIDGLPQSVRFSDGHWVSLEADPDGRIMAAHNPNGTVRLAYDEAGALIAENQNGVVVSYERDRTGLLTAIVLPDGERLGFRYDQAGRLAEVVDWAGGRIGVRWAANGQLAGLTHPNGVTSELQSDQLARITRLATTVNGGGRPLFEASYAYDVMDRLVEAVEGGATHRFSYDPLDRLTGVQSSDPAFAEAWELDALGNRVNDRGTPLSADPDNLLAGAGIAHDDFGRVRRVATPNGPATLTYNGQGQLVRAELASGTVADYAYDALGRRIWKRVNGLTTRFLWAGQTLLCEWHETPGGPWTRRDHLVLPDMFLPLAMRVDGRIYQHHCDRRGVPHATTDESGAPVWQAAVKPFGEAVVRRRTVDNPWRLANQYCDLETGLHYNLARYMHPDLGRYLTPDPLFDHASHGNWYIYGAGDPLGRADPTGEILPLVIGAVVIGAAVGGGIKAYQTRNQDLSAGQRAKEIGKGALIGGAVGLVGALAGKAALAAAGVKSLAGVSIKSLIGYGALAGGVSGVAESCTESLLHGQRPSVGDAVVGGLLGAALGALTVGAGALLGRLARGGRKLLNSRRIRQAGQTPASSVPSGFKPNVDDGTKRALNAFPHTDGGKISRELKGKSLNEIEDYMRRNYPDVQPSSSTLTSPSNNPSGVQVTQKKWELPDGTIVRVKETSPPGQFVDNFRQEPTLSVSSRKRQPNGDFEPVESYQNEAFKVDQNGNPVPKGPADVDTTGLTQAEKNAKVSQIMNDGHRSVSR